MAVHFRAFVILKGLLLLATTAIAQESASTPPTRAQALTTSSNRVSDSMPTSVLTQTQWRRVDVAVNRALNWLASRQQSDGSFSTLDSGQPAVTSLCMMAFIAHGHVPGKGQYGARLDRATDYVLSCQKENGLVTKLGPDGPQINRQVSRAIGGCATYNHAISSLMLSEVYGMSPPARARRLEAAIRKALAATLEMQVWPKDSPADKGGWRYLDNFDDVDSDLSVTGWQLMFLRSAPMPVSTFLPSESKMRSRLLNAASIGARGFSYTHRGAQAAPGRWPAPEFWRWPTLACIIRKKPSELATGCWRMDSSNTTRQSQAQASDRYHYGLFNCCQAMYQLGGKYWEQFYPPAVEAVLANQEDDGSWPVDSQYHDAPYGKAYSTALVVIMLGAPNQLLPIYQR